MDIPYIIGRLMYWLNSKEIKPVKCIVTWRVFYTFGI
jgi:hypothetical protein